MSRREFVKSLGRAGGLVGAGVAIFGISASLYNGRLAGSGWTNSLVDGGYRAIKYSRFGGLREKVYGEGTHLMIPWIERPILYEVRAKPRNVASLTGTKGMLFSG